MKEFIIEFFSIINKFHSVLLNRGGGRIFDLDISKLHQQNKSYLHGSILKELSESFIISVN